LQCIEALEACEQYFSDCLQRNLTPPPRIVSAQDPGQKAARVGAHHALTAAIIGATPKIFSTRVKEERTRILRRTNEGRIAAIKRGTKLGRKSKLDDHQQQEAINRLKAGGSLRAIAKSYRVHHATIARLAG
jgi:DNA invertase Pin-like site-specific DNA recombinase